MTKHWDEAALQQYITDEVEESLTLDYKAADSLGKADKKKAEITKDVSAMANSAGGVIVYGISEFNDPAKKHLPEALSPINRRDYSKEWLEQVINNIRPHIDGLVIQPVSLSSGPDDVAYVVEIPQSNTAHQATDHRYYKRFNFLSQPMEDYEIRDIFNRQQSPNASVEFGFEQPDLKIHTYVLKVYVKNLGTSVINNFQLVFTFPKIIGYESIYNKRIDNVDFISKDDFIITYRSKSVLYPDENREIGNEIKWVYKMDGSKYNQITSTEYLSDQSAIRKYIAFVDWTLYADNMTPKKGSVSFSELCNF